MTREEYLKRNEIYMPRHGKQMYHVLIVRSPAGPQEQYNILGLDEAKGFVYGAWDYEIIRISDGKVIL